MSYTQNTLLLSILLIPTAFFGLEKNSFAHINKNNSFKKSMCASVSSMPTVGVFGTLLKSGFPLYKSFFGATMTGFATYGLCSKVSDISDPFEDFKNVFNTKSRSSAEIIKRD